MNRFETRDTLRSAVQGDRPAQSRAIRQVIHHTTAQGEPVSATDVLRAIQCGVAALAVGRDIDTAAEHVAGHLGLEW